MKIHIKHLTDEVPDENQEFNASDLQFQFAFHLAKEELGKYSISYATAHCTFLCADYAKFNALLRVA